MSFSFLKIQFRHSGYLQNLLYYFLFLILVAVLYGRVIFFDIVYFDDHLWVKSFHDYLTRGIHWWEFFGRADLVTELYYRPLLNLSFAVDARSGGGSPVSYHVTNLVIHWINVCLVFGLLQAWGFSRLRALAGALILLTHPVLVQSVVWIPGRTDSLLAMFCFSGFWLYLRYLKQKQWFDFAGYALCLIGALLTKETGIALAFMIVLWDVFLSRKSVSRFRDAWKIPAVTAGIVFVWFLIRLQAVVDAPEMGWDRKIHSFIENLPTVWLYLGKVFLPFNLSVFPMMKDASLMYGFITFGILLVIVVFCFLNKLSFPSPIKTFGDKLQRKSILKQQGSPTTFGSPRYEGIKALGDDKELQFEDGKRILFGASWFIFFLLPSLVLSDLAYEYRLYVPMLGALIVILELFPKNINRGMCGLLLIVIIGILSATLWRYSSSYKDQWIFWTRAAADAPHSALAQKNLGSMYYLKNNYDKAEEYYHKSLAINPFEKMVNNNLGLIYQGRGDSAKAMEYYQQEIKSYPDYELPYFNWGLFLIKEKRFAEAISFIEKALECNPLLKDPYDYLMQMYLNQGDFDKAKSTARRLKSTGADIPSHVLDRARQLHVDLLN